MPRLTNNTALLIVDVINDLDFPGGEKVLPWAQKMAHQLLPVRSQFRKAGLPVIYANDNFGRWRSNFADVYKTAAGPGKRGREITRRLKPGTTDYFILKPKMSAFFATSLEPLLDSLGVRQLVVVGIATNLCVLFTAHDAHMREYDIIVLSDCCAAESDFDHNAALEQLQRFLGVKVCRSDELSLPLKRSRPARRAGPAKRGR